MILKTKSINMHFLNKMPKSLSKKMSVLNIKSVILVTLLPDNTLNIIIPVPWSIKENIMKFSHN